MKIVDVGSGPPVVVIPGVQGRWEWMKPCIDALAKQCRVVTFSLADEASSLADYIEQARKAMDAVGLERAAVCGVSYGGLIAATFAARHPDRTASLVLVSAIPPSWTPNRRIRFYLRAPRLLSPLFCIASVRMYREIAVATPGRAAGIRAAFRHGWTAATHMFSPGRMAHRVHALAGLHLQEEVSCVKVPVLLVTGEPALDRVVPVQLTREYLTFWPDARVATIERTGHLGYVTRPEEFTRLVAPFVEQTACAYDSRRRVG
jgi:pimeloyl-ACP methyl ester carboxylesterase